MSKKLLITHDKDIDGMGSAILCRAIWGDDIEIWYSTAYDVDSHVKKLLADDLYKKYDQIFIADLGVSDAMGEKLDSIFDLKPKLTLRDHHNDKIGLNKYDWAKVFEEDDELKTSGTEMFYQYLLEVIIDEEKARIC